MYIKFPLTKDFKMHVFKEMIWNYSLMFIEVEDYKKIGRPKKVAASFIAVWGGVGFYLKYLY